MGMDDTVYGNWFRYMSNVLDQIQGMSDYSGRSYTGQVSYGEQSFSDILNTMLQFGSLEDTGFSRSVQSTADTRSNTYAQSSGSQSMDAIFEEAAKLYGVPLNLLMAMGKAESGFDANAVSSAGAQGVMQLMPATARSLGVDDPFDARSNIMGGAKYISQKLKQYNGDIDLALAAYNAGSGNVAKYGGVPPFKETRNYIRRIREYMNSDLTTGKTVESRNRADAAAGTSGIRVSDAKESGRADSTYKLSQDNAQYFVEMMRLQMLNRAGTLSRGFWSSGGSESDIIL